MEPMHHMDKMTNKERIRSLILQEEVDRVPFLPFFVGCIGIDNGISLYDFYRNPELAFEAGLRTMKKYPWANIRPVYGWTDHGAWIFDGKKAWPKREGGMAPYSAEPLICSPEEVDHVPDPDPWETDWFRRRDCFNELSVKNGFTAQLPSGSIMILLGSILGVTNLLRWIKKHPDALKRLAEKVFRFNLKMTRITLEKYGPRKCNVLTEVPLESNSIISPKVFEEFSLPYIIRTHSIYVESGVRSIIVHLCGDHKSNLTYWKHVPLPDRTIFSIGDSMDLEEVGEFVGKKNILAGNISTTTLQFGSKEDVKEEVKRCLKQAKKRLGGFILMPACEYPPMAPDENLEAVRETLMSHGFY